MRKTVFSEANENSLHNTLVRFIKTKGIQEVDGDLDVLDKFLTLNVPELAS